MRFSGPTAKRRAAKRRKLMAEYAEACRVVDQRAEGLCEWCGSGSWLDHHHVKPRSTHPDLIADPNNIRLLCRSCHMRAHGRI